MEVFSVLIERTSGDWFRDKNSSVSEIFYVLKKKTLLFLKAAQKTSDSLDQVGVNFEYQSNRISVESANIQKPGLE